MALNLQSIQNEGNVGIDYILNEAKTIWKEFKAQGIDHYNYEKLDAYRLQVIEKHPQFASSYPTVLRHMIQEYKFTANAFKKYLMKLEKNPWKNDDERLESYADYYTCLYKDNPKLFGESHWNATSARTLHDNYLRVLQIEQKKIIDSIEAAEKDFDQKTESYKVKRLRTAINMFDDLARDQGLPQETIDILHKMVAEDKMSVETVENICAEMINQGAHLPIKQSTPDSIAKENE